MNKKRVISGVKTVGWLAAGVWYVYCCSICGYNAGYNLMDLLIPEKENED